MTNVAIDDLREIVRKLKDTGEDGFEGLLASVLTDITKTAFSLAKSGPQRGKDGQSTYDSGTIAFEAKLYDGKVKTSELIYKIAEIAADDRGQVDLWVAGSTGQIPVQDAETITAVGTRLAIGTLILDWPSTGLPGLAVLLAMAPDQSVTFIADNTGTPEATIRDSLDAVLLHPQFSDRARELLIAIQQPSVGPAYALKRNAEFLRAAFGSRAKARVVFGQALAPGDNSAPGLLDRTELRGTLAASAFSRPNGGTVAVLGSDGNGKSWLFGQCWLNHAPKPLTIVIVPDDVKEHFTQADVEPLLVATLITQTGDSDNETNRARWRKHFDRWRRLEFPEQPRLVVFLDGLNQREGIDWPRAMNAIGGVVTELGGKLVFSCRTPFYRTTIKARLLDPVHAVDVPEWTNPELQQLLAERGTSIDQLPKQMVEFLRNPRIFAVAADLYQQGRVQFSDLSISRLLFEHIRAGASPAAEPLSVAEFVRGVRSHADDIIQRLQTSDGLDAHVFSRKVGPAVSSLTLKEQLAVISAGRFFEEVPGDPTLYSLKEDGLPFALGLSLLSTAQKAHRNHQNIADELSKILDPISALDNTAEVLMSALIVSVLSEDATPEIVSALATSYVALQNLDANRFQEFRTLVRDTPAAFLRALEEAAIAEETVPNLSWITSALHESRTEDVAWASITAAAQRWLSMYSPAPERMVHVQYADGTEKRRAAVAKSQLEIDAKIAAFSQSEKDVIASLVLEQRGDYTKLNKIAFELLAGRPLKAFGQAFLNWCMAASFNGGIWDGREEFYHLIQLNRVDWNETRIAILEAAKVLRSEEISETGRWALVYALRSTGDKVDSNDAVPIVEGLIKGRERSAGWRLVENWCATDPCDPSSERPDNIEQTAEKYRDLDVTTLKMSMGGGREDHFFDGARVGLARFAPQVALTTMRRFAESTISRATPDFRLAAFLLENHTAALEDQAAALFVAKANAIADEILAGDEDKHKELFVASQYSFMIAFPHFTGDEQLTALINYPRIDNILLSTCDLMQDASPQIYESALERAYAAGDTINQFRLMAFAQYTDTAITERARSIVGELTSSTTALVRLCAFAAIRRINDPNLLRVVVDSGWNANLLDVAKSRFEIWYGSQVLVLAAAQNLISVAECIDRITLGAYADFARALGAEAADLIAARISSAIKKAAGHTVATALPEIVQNIGTGNRPDLYSVEERPDPNEGVRASFERLSETGAAWYERQMRNRAAAEQFERELTKAGADLIIQAITPKLVTELFEHAPNFVRTWHIEFMAMDNRTLRAVHNVALSVARAIAAENQTGAVALFEKLIKSDPFVRITIGTSGLSLDAVTVWEAGDGEELRSLRWRRLDHAPNDAEIAREVLAAIRAGKVDQLRDYVLDRRARLEPAHVARAIMISGFCIETPWAHETLETHKDDTGFLSSAYRAAKYAMERHQWAKQWARKMRDTQSLTDLWRYAVIFTTIVDGRFHQDELKGGTHPDLINRYGPTFNSLIRNRIKKWQDNRAKKLFGQNAPDEIYLV